MKVSLFLMTQKGFSVLEAIVKRGLSENIDFIVVSPDKNVKKDFHKEIVSLAKENNIRCYERNDAYELNTQYCIAISWRWIIDTNRSKVIVLHDSLLPKYRGFAPLVNMLINKENYIGVTSIFASNEYDRGDIIEQRKVPVSYPIKIQDAIELLTPLYVDAVLSIILKISNGEKIDCFAQNEGEATYSLWRDEEDYVINWNDSSSNIKRFIDSVGFPYKGAKTVLNKASCFVLDADTVEDVKIENRTPGKVIFMDNGYPVVVCGVGLLKLNNIVDAFGKSLLPLSKFRSRFV